MDEQAARLMAERFGRDCVIALATVGGEPFVRFVNAYYEGGSFYVITHGLSGKMRQLREPPLRQSRDVEHTKRSKGQPIIRQMAYFPIS